MSKKHDAIFDDVLSGLDTSPAPKADRAGARFLNRSNRVSERLSGDIEEKSLRWVDPDECRMWDRHNRAYDLLTEDNCRDLIDGIRSQGRQEFPAIVRKTDDPDKPYEVICGARRHFAVTWLRANNYPQFRYLVELRDLTDEEAFRLGDIENRDREDISDYERACDYADAVTRYYGGKQKAMAERIEMSEAWLSRYLQLAKLPEEIVAAFSSIREIKELHARTLKPFLGRPEDRAKLLETARALAADRVNRDGVQVMNAFKSAMKPPAAEKPAAAVYQAASGKPVMTCSRKGKKLVMELPADVSQDDLHELLAVFMRDHFSSKSI